MTFGAKLKSLKKAFTGPITSRLAYDKPSIELHKINTPFQGFAINAFPDDDCVASLKQFKDTLKVKLVAIRLTMDMKDMDGNNSALTPKQVMETPIEDLVTAWLNCAKFYGDTLSKIGQYCLKEDISIVFTFNLLPDEFKRNNLVVSDHSEALAKLTAAGVAAFFRKEIPVWGIEVLNEPSADPEWGVKCPPKVYTNVIEKLFYYLSSEELPYIPKVLVAGVHNVFTDCLGYLREIVRRDFFSKYKSNICYSYHFYERGYSHEEHDKAFWNTAKLTDYLEATILNGTSEDNKLYLNSFDGVFPVHVTEIATHWYNLPNGIVCNATNIQKRLEYAISVAHNIIAAVSAGQGPLYLWLLKDYYWFNEKWGIITEKNEVDYISKPLSLFLKFFSEGVYPGSTVLSCMHSPKSIVENIRSIAFVSKVKAHPINTKELNELHRNNSLYYHYHHTENDADELIICVASTSVRKVVTVNIVFPDYTDHRRISTEPLKIEHSPAGNVGNHEGNDYAVKLTLSNNTDFSQEYVSTSPGYALEVLSRTGSLMHNNHSEELKHEMPSMMPINGTNITIDMPGTSYVFLYFALA